MFVKRSLSGALGFYVLRFEVKTNSAGSFRALSRCTNTALEQLNSIKIKVARHALAYFKNAISPSRHSIERNPRYEGFVVVSHKKRTMRYK